MCEWVKTSERKPIPDSLVRVVWLPHMPSDRKTAYWDGEYWWTARKAGIYDTAPDYWLHVDIIPFPPVFGSDPA